MGDRLFAKAVALFVVTVFVPSASIAKAVHDSVAHNVSVTSVERFEDAGLALEIRIADNHGSAVLGNLLEVSGLSVVGKYRDFDTKIKSAKKSNAHLAIVVSSSEAENRMATLRSAKKIIESRPVDERLAIYQWHNGLKLMKGFNSSREDLIQTIDQMIQFNQLENIKTSKMDAESLAVGLKAISKLSINNASDFHAAIVLSDDELIKKRVLSYQTGMPVMVASGFELQIRHDDNAARVRNWIDAYKQYGYYRIELCGAEEATELEFNFHNKKTVVTVPLGTPKNAALC